MTGKLASVKVGDLVTRYLCGIPMQLHVTAVTETTIECGAWTFSKITGGEIDEELDWDGLGRTGSYIRVKG